VEARIGEASFVPLAIDTERRHPASAVTDRIVIEVNGMVLKLAAQTAACRISIAAGLLLEPRPAPSDAIPEAGSPI